MSAKPKILAKSFYGRYAVSTAEGKIWLHTERISDGSGNRHTVDTSDLVDIALMLTDSAARLWVNNAANKDRPEDDPGLELLTRLLTANEELKALHSELRAAKGSTY